MIATVAGGKKVASGNDGVVLAAAADLVERGYTVWLRDVKGAQIAAELRSVEGQLVLTHGTDPEPGWVSSARRYLSNTRGACT